jgi:predicted transcriptional regulator of viral defense system
MKYRDSKQALRALYAIAVRQGGYFTAKQAGGAGYGKRHLVYHAKAGNFERVGRGLYRLPTVPPSEHDDLIRVTLWSRGRDDRPLATVSYESALALHQMSDVIPARIHLTVPKSFRKRAPRGCVLHKTEISPQEVEEREGFRVSNAARTLVDVASGKTVPREQLFQAVEDSLARGLIRKKKLIEIIKDHPQAHSLLLAPALAS